MSMVKQLSIFSSLTGKRDALNNNHLKLNSTMIMKSIIAISGIVVLILLNSTTNAQHTMENKHDLDNKQQSIVAIAALTAKGDIPQLKIHLVKGLEAGLTISEIKEELVQLYAYCGFPRSLNGITTLMSVLAER